MNALVGFKYGYFKPGLIVIKEFSFNFYKIKNTNVNFQFVNSSTNQQHMGQDNHLSKGASWDTFPLRRGELEEVETSQSFLAPVLMREGGTFLLAILTKF